MKWFCCLVGLVWALAAGAVSADKGYVQVRGPAGITILLDGQPAGMTQAAPADLVVADVAPGKHVLRAMHRGFLAEEAVLVVEAGKVTFHALGQVAPLLGIAELSKPAAEPIRRVGSLIIHTVPRECELDLPDLELTGKRKTLDLWLLDGVPMGKFQVIARALGKTLSTRVAISEGLKSEWVFDFVADDVYEVTPLVNSLGLVLVPIRPGRYTMGSPNGRACEKPHEVSITRGFWMSDREVTVRQWRQVMGDRDPLGVLKDTPLSFPVLCTWDDAVLFTIKLAKLENKPPSAYRLATEAEWEYCCRAGTTDDYAGPLKELAWFAETSLTGEHKLTFDSLPIRKQQPVGTRRPNAWGLYDMHGSAAEWCLDRCRQTTDGNGQPVIETATYSLPEKAVDPVNYEGPQRLLRGGDFQSSAVECASWHRAASRPDYHAGGIRLVYLPDVSP